MFKKKRDNLVDGAGYFATLEKMEDEKNSIDSLKMNIDKNLKPSLTTQINQI